jgi:hypothetical protein
MLAGALQRLEGRRLLPPANTDKRRRGEDDVYIGVQSGGPTKTNFLMGCSVRWCKEGNPGVVASASISASAGYKSAAEAAIARDVSMLHLYGGELPHSYIGSSKASINAMNWDMDLQLAKQLVADGLAEVHSKFALLTQHTVRMDSGVFVVRDAADMTQVVGKAGRYPRPPSGLADIDVTSEDAAGAGAAGASQFEAITGLGLTPPQMPLLGVQDVVQHQRRWLRRRGIQFDESDVRAATLGDMVPIADLRDLKKAQVTALRILLESIESRDGQWHLLTGYAGTGKTIAAKVLARVMQARGVDFVQCAYTNSATAELGGMKSFEPGVYWELPWALAPAGPAAGCVQWEAARRASLSCTMSDK